MTSFSISAILGTNDYERDESLESRKKAEFPMKKSNERKFTNTEDEGKSWQCFKVTIVLKKGDA